MKVQIQKTTKFSLALPPKPLIALTPFVRTFDFSFPCQPMENEILGTITIQSATFVFLLFMAGVNNRAPKENR
jgi:hypothetical protein